MRSVFLNMMQLSLMLVLILTGSCSKNVPGPKGDPGEPGKRGEARQSHLSTSVPASAWITDGSVWTTRIFTELVTEEVRAKGDIEVYMQIGETWWALPYAKGDVFMEARMEKGIVHLKYSKIHDGPPAVPQSANFRISVISPM